MGLRAVEVVVVPIVEVRDLHWCRLVVHVLGVLRGLFDIEDLVGAHRPYLFGRLVEVVVL